MYVPIQNCKKCGRLFVSSGSMLCPECIEKEDEQFQIVKRYLTENPGSSVMTVSEKTGVAVETVTEFIRQGRLMGMEPQGTENVLVCIICKKPISAGRICDECQKALSGRSSDVSGKENGKIDVERPKLSIDEQNERIGERMYTIDLIRRKKQ